MSRRKPRLHFYVDGIFPPLFGGGASIDLYALANAPVQKFPRMTRQAAGGYAFHKRAVPVFHETETEARKAASAEPVIAAAVAG